MQKIALVNCFFGNFPWYFNFFLKSCSTNPTVDFIIFSDNKYQCELPCNVKIVDFTMEDFNALASEKLGIKINVTAPYKLCDFKPAYGTIFSDYLMDYHFWGMCDLDVILGRIREFMTSDVLNQYDVISTRHDFLTGWFMLFRNTKDVNELFTRSSDYVKVFSSQVHYCFDECNFKHLQLQDEEISILEVQSEIDSMEHVIRRELQQGKIHVFYDLIMIDGHCGKMEWNNGILTYNKNFEILLYHLIRYKANLYSNKPIWESIPDLFFIDKYAFRKQHVLSVRGFCNYFYFNKINLWVSKLIHLIKFYISTKIKRKSILALQNGEYKNMQGQECIWVWENKISLYQHENTTHTLRSKFKSDVFYIENYKWLKFSYFDSKTGESPKIQLVQIDGSISNYKLKL